MSFLDDDVALEYPNHVVFTAAGNVAESSTDGRTVTLSGAGDRIVLSHVYPDPPLKVDRFIGPA